MYLLTGCLCGEVPAARSRPPCRAGGFQAESRVAGADGMRTPGGAWLRASARPHFYSKNWSTPGPAASPETGSPPVSDRAVPPECSRKWETSRFAGGRLPDGSRQLGGVKAQMPLETEKPPIPDSPSPSGNSRWRDTARFCQGQNRQTAAGEGGCQSANAAGYREAVRARQYRLTGKLPAAGHGPVLPRAKSPNGVWRRAVSKLKRFQRLSGARAPCSRRGGPGRWTAPAGRSHLPPPGRPGGG